MVNLVIYRFNVPRSFKTAVVAELKNPHKAKRSFISVKKAVSSNMFQKENRPCREEEKTFTKEKMAGGKEDTLKATLLIIGPNTAMYMAKPIPT